MAENMTVVINGKKYNIEFSEISFDCLDPDPRNPRLAVEIVSNGDKSLSVQQIIEAFESNMSTATLIANIQENQGIIQPILVKPKPDARFMVREGNRRWYSYYCMQDDGYEWTKMMPCYVIPQDMDENSIKQLIGILHVNGPESWSAYSKFSFARDFKKSSGASDDMIMSKYGYSKSDYINATSTFEVVTDFMTETNTKDPMWSQWYEAIKGNHAKMNALLSVPETKKAAYQIMEQRKLINPHVSRHLRSILESPFYTNLILKATSRDDVESVIAEIQKTSRKSEAEQVIQSMSSLCNLIRNRKRKLNTLLSLKHTTDKNVITELLAELVSLARDSDNMSLVDSIMSKKSA